MKKNRSAETLRGPAALRRMGAAAVLLCAIAGTPTAYTQDPASNQATLNFVGADIESVVKAVGHYTRNTFIIDPRVKGTINLVSEKPVTKAQAMQMLTSALRLQGFAVVRADGFLKVVPEADAKLQAGPTQAGDVRGDQIATQIFRLNYESANNLVQVLRPLISPNNTINVNPGNNSIVITDYADNLKRLGRIIAALDSPAVGDLDIIPIRHAAATDLAQIVNRLMEQGGAPVAGVADAGRVSVLADSRSNSLIIRAPSVARANLAKSLIAKLDQPTAQPGNVHVVYLKNADAVRLAQTLRAVVASDTSTPQVGNQPQQPQQPQATAAGQQSQLGQGALQQSAAQSPTALPAGGPAGFIQADPATNALIITASEAVYRNLRSVIDQLDARRAQVYVESLIVEVSAEKAAELGVQWAGLSGDETSRYRLGVASGFGQGGNNLINQAIANAGTSGPLPPGNGLNIGIFRQINGSLTLGAIARALETEGNANILSMPNLITLDNEEARIIVGQNVPFVTGQFTTQASGGAAGVNPFQTIERRDVGLALRVRPQVSEGGTVKMAIYQEISAVLPRTAGTSDITTTKRSIETNVLVDDGQILVLGGLIEDRVEDGVEKVPALGDIPVVGNLFKYQTRKGTKTSLMVFLRPTVVRTNFQSNNVAGDRYEFIRNVQTESRGSSVILPEVQTPILPPLQDGRPVGGSMLNLPPAGRPEAMGVPPSSPPPENQNPSK
ncbi:type II secretion system secretin GspD [Noviherbaspirillum sp. ST9]|uniref:type II secretion system secretin GspD n=1 Tax=Noviherbaspirillum sp. ST9 TaxID=3401606 RepID=UPI003B58A55C